MLRFCIGGGNETTYIYDGVGNLIASKNRNGHTTLFKYDELNRQIQRTDALGNSEYLSYDAVGNIKTYTNARGYTSIYTYDELNRVIEETDALGNSTLYSYDASGNLINRTDRNGNMVSYTYDSLNQLKSLTDALDQQTQNHFEDLFDDLYDVKEAAIHLYKNFETLKNIPHQKTKSGKNLYKEHNKIMEALFEALLGSDEKGDVRTARDFSDVIVEVRTVGGGDSQKISAQELRQKNIFFTH